MSTPLQRLQQMMLGVEGIRNDRRRLDQQDTALTQAADAQKLQTAIGGVNMLSALLTQAGQLSDEAQNILPEVIQQTTLSDGTPLLNYEALARVVPAVPQSVDFYARGAARRSDQRDEVNHERTLTELQNIPDATVRDAAINSFTQSLSGMGAGAARQQGTLANREAIPDDKMGEAMQMALGLVMTPAQLEENKLARQRIAQGWKGLGLQESFGEFDRALNLAEFRWRQDAAIATASGRGVSGGSPVELTKQVVDLLGELEKPGQSDGARAVLQTSLYQVMRQMAQTAVASGDMATAELLQKIEPKDIAKMGPRAVLPWLKDFITGAASNPMPSVQNPFGMPAQPNVAPGGGVLPMVPPAQTPPPAPMGTQGMPPGAGGIPPEVFQQLPPELQQILMMQGGMGGRP